jgi:hypothetical protein
MIFLECAEQLVESGSSRGFQNLVSDLNEVVYLTQRTSMDTTRPGSQITTYYRCSTKVLTPLLLWVSYDT